MGFWRKNMLGGVDGMVDWAIDEMIGGGSRSVGGRQICVHRSRPTVRKARIGDALVGKI